MGSRGFLRSRSPFSPWGAATIVALASLVSVMIDTSGYTATEGAPAIHFLQDVISFAPILEGESADISFEFVNRGGKPLLIHDAVTSCGCTTAEYPRRPVRPGGAGTIRTTFQSRGHGGDVDLTLLVKSNDPQSPEKVLHIRGQVTRQWQVKPDRLVATNLSSGPAYEKSFQLINYMDVPLRIREVSSDADFIRLLAAPQEVPPGGEKTLTCAIHSQGLEPGRVRQSSIRISVEGARLTAVDIPVLVKLR